MYFVVILYLSGLAACFAKPTCTPGSYLSGSGCITCPDGRYSNSGANSVFDCYPCSPGYYSVAGQPCTQCSSGTHSPFYASVYCPLSPPGYYVGENGATAYSICGEGTYSLAGASSCLTCPFGSYSLSTGASSCTVCSAGTTNSGGNSPCTVLTTTDYTSIATTTKTESTIIKEVFGAAPKVIPVAYTGAVQTYMVPAGATSMTVVAIGGKGGDYTGCQGTSDDDGILYPRYGGFGGLIASTMSATPGATLNIYVGGAGENGPADLTQFVNVKPMGGFNGGGDGGLLEYVIGKVAGGGGGGATDIRTGTALSSRLIVAGGGGGAGHFGNGGVGGGATETIPSLSKGYGAFAGDSTACNALGYCINGAISRDAGGGGGGYVPGKGGGEDGVVGGAGNGGSSYAAGTVLYNTRNVSAGNGMVLLSFSMTNSGTAPAGYYLASGINQPCPANTFSTSGSNTCLACPTGSSSQPGSPSCTCKAGYSLSGASCVACAAGSYSPYVGALCAVCPAGSYSSLAASSCSLCGVNTYTVSPGSSQCSSCPYGTTASEGSTGCELASFVPVEAASAPAGYYMPTGESVYYICSAGTYSVAGSSSCSECSSNFFSGPAAASCLPCPVNTYSNPGQSFCSSCSYGYAVSGGGCMSHQPTYRIYNKFAFAVVTTDSHVHTWGDQAYGGSMSSTLTSQISQAGGVLYVVGNSLGYAAILNNGTVTAWGAVLHGSIVKPSSITSADTLVANDYAFCVITHSGSVEAFGRPSYGGYIDPAYVTTDVITFLTSHLITRVVPSSVAFAALTVDGHVATWGVKSAGGGVSTTTMPALSGVANIFSNRLAFAALRSDSTLVTWGSTAYGGGQSLQPASGILTVFASRASFAVLTGAQGVVTIGDETLGGDSTAVATMLQSGVTSITSSYGAYAALKSDGSVVAWGASEAGLPYSGAGLVVSAGSGVYQIFANLNAFVGLTTTGAVITWGDSSTGGDGADSALPNSGIYWIYPSLLSFTAVVDVSEDDSTGSYLVPWGDAINGGSLYPYPNVTDVASLCSNDVGFVAISPGFTASTWGNQNYMIGDAAIKSLKNVASCV